MSLIAFNQISEELGVTRTTLMRWVRGGFRGPTGELVQLKAIKVGRGWRVKREDLEAFLASCQVPVIEPSRRGR